MNNFVKATVRKLAELPWPDLRDLFTWESRGETIRADNQHLLVAKASNDKGQPIAFVTAEPVLIVDGYVFNPQSTPIEATNAGDAIDKALAEKAGANRVWIVIPDEAPTMEGEKVIRVMERRVYQPVSAQERGCCVTKQQQPAFLN